MEILIRKISLLDKIIGLSGLFEYQALKTMSDSLYYSDTSAVFRDGDFAECSLFLIAFTGNSVCVSLYIDTSSLSICPTDRLFQLLLLFHSPNEILSFLN